jgi:hypothetical protein
MSAPTPSAATKTLAALRTIVTIAKAQSRLITTRVMRLPNRVARGATQKMVKLAVKTAMVVAAAATIGRRNRTLAEAILTALPTVIGVRSRPITKCTTSHTMFRRRT